METTPLQQLSTAVSMLLVLILVMKPKLRAILDEPRPRIQRGKQDSHN